MKVVQVILGYQWFYDRDVRCASFAKENKYSLMLKNQKLLLKTMAVADMGKYRT